MRSINIKSSIRNYKIKFTSSLKKDLNKISKSSDIYLIDNKVFKLHRLEKYIDSKNILLIDANEKSKSFEELNKVIKKILSTNFKKNHRIIVVGGGITQDIGSFISSIIFRGVEWLFIPTSFLSQCDSCIGGKTSINFFGKKNQIGNFNPPSLIYIDTKFLSTLSSLDISSGIGEMAHYFLVNSKEDYIFFKKLYEQALVNNQKACLKLISRSLKIKKKFIEKDEFDKKERLILNYGHTFGHAIESLTNFKIPHGVAVANGMNIANYISLKMNLLNQKEFDEMNLILEKIYKDIRPKKINSKKYLDQLRKDKKNTNNNLKCILTRGVGKMFIKELKFNENLTKMLLEYDSKYC